MPVLEGMLRSIALWQGAVGQCCRGGAHPSVLYGGGTVLEEALQGGLAGCMKCCSAERNPGRYCKFADGRLLTLPLPIPPGVGVPLPPGPQPGGPQLADGLPPLQLLLVALHGAAVHPVPRGAVGQELDHLQVGWHDGCWMCSQGFTGQVVFKLDGRMREVLMWLMGVQC